METVYLQSDIEVRELLSSGYCEKCLKPASEWAEQNRFGHVLVHAACDTKGNLVGYLCPECTAACQTERPPCARS